MRVLTTAEAAKILGVIPRRIRQLIESGEMPAQRVGRDWLILETDVHRAASQRKKPQSE